MQKQTNYIAVIDSGSGGLTIANAIIKKFAKINLVYAADSENFPYGNKTPERIKESVLKLIRNVVAQFPIELLVIACNTASTFALDDVRQNFSFPVIGVVPAIKPAAALSVTKIIGVLATPATINGSYLDNLVQEFAANCKVVKLASQELVDLAEQKAQGKKVDLSRIKEIISPLFISGLDTVVLGCTHFPLVLEELVKSSPWKVNWIDSNEAIVNRVDQLVKAKEGDSKRVFIGCKNTLT